MFNITLDASFPTTDDKFSDNLVVSIVCEMYVSIFLNVYRIRFPNTKAEFEFFKFPPQCFQMPGTH